MRRSKSWRLLAGAAATLALISAFYGWTASTSSPGPSGGAGESAAHPEDAFALMADGFLHGRLDLPVTVPRGLLALRDPYDPAANQRFRDAGVQDLVLFHSRLYSPWGPAPAILVYAPLRLVGIDTIGHRTAVLLFALVGLAFFCATAAVVAPRLVPRAPGWAVLLGVATFAVGSFMPYLLRRPAVYEVAIAAGFCFLWAGVWALARGLLVPGAGRRWRWAASALVGVAFTSRPPLGAAAVLLAGAAWIAWRGGRRDGGEVVALLAPFMAIVVLALLYNLLRFDSPLEFGQPFVLAAENHQQRTFNSPSYLLPGLWSYLIGPPHLTLQFPFVGFPPPPGYPSSAPAIYKADRVVGALTLLPVLWLLPAAAVLRGPVRRVAAGLVAAAALVVVSLSVSFWFAYGRYEADFAGMLLAAALLSWLGLAERLAGRRRRALMATGGVLAAVSLVAAAATSVTGAGGGLVVDDPKAQASLERFFSPLPTLAARLAGHPLVVAVDGDPEGARPRWGRLSLDGGDALVVPGGVVQVAAAESEPAIVVASPAPGPAGIPPGFGLVLTFTAPDGSTGALPADGKPHAVALRLGKGLTDLRVGVDYRPALGATDPLRTAPVWLRSLRVRDNG